MQFGSGDLVGSNHFLMGEEEVSQKFWEDFYLVPHCLNLGHATALAAVQVQFYGIDLKTVKVG